MNTNNSTNAKSTIFNTASDLRLSSTLNMSQSSSFQQQQQQQQQGQQKQGAKSQTNNEDSIAGVNLIQDSGANKRIKMSSANKKDSHSFFADLNDIDKPCREEISRRNKFAEKRRIRTEKHVLEHAEGILLQVLNMEAELQAPEDQQEDYLATINDRSSSRSYSLSARRSERHHLAVALDILGEIDGDDDDGEHH